jgi:hypothetical protein
MRFPYPVNSPFGHTEHDTIVKRNTCWALVDKRKMSAEKPSKTNKELDLDERQVGGGIFHSRCSLVEALAKEVIWRFVAG